MTGCLHAGDQSRGYKDQHSAAEARIAPSETAVLVREDHAPTGGGTGRSNGGRPESVGGPGPVQSGGQRGGWIWRRLESRGWTWW
jgi:hypothetical protein